MPTANPNAGQRQRVIPGTWERSTNKQQRRLVRAFDSWSAKVRKQINEAAQRGVSQENLISILDRNLPTLASTLVDITTKGIQKALRVSGESRAKEPELVKVANEQIAENTKLVQEALIPNIREKLVAKIEAGIGLDKAELKEDFTLVRAGVAQYAGGAWVMIFLAQQALGRIRERQRKEEGLPIEKVRWVLDKAAEHCVDSPGFHGCPSLAGEYVKGWDSLPTVPAGNVTCRGNCRCHLEVFRDNQWRRGVF